MMGAKYVELYVHIRYCMIGAQYVVVYALLHDGCTICSTVCVTA